MVGAAVPTGAANVLCFENAGSLDADAIQVLLNSLASDSPWEIMHSSVTIPEYLIKFGPDSTGAFEIRSSSMAGQSGGEPGGAQVSMLIRKSTALGGRKNRGRVYIPAIPEEFIDVGGVLDTTVVSTFQGVWDAWAADLAVGGLEACVEHSDGSTPTPITAFTVMGVVATQRRRQRR